MTATTAASRIRAAAAVACVAATVAACGARRPAGAPDAWPREPWIVDGRTGQRASFGAMIEDLALADAVFVGEDHDDPAHHAAQRRILEALSGRHPDLAVGLEMLQTPHQPAADRFASGTTDLPAFIAETDWERTWGFPIELYRPILDLVRARKLGLFALNAPGELVRRLSRQGLEALSEEDREALPEMDLENEAHRDFVRKAFSAHHEMPEDRFLRFYAVQVLWDETMAERTVRAMKSEPGAAVVDESAPPDRFVVVFAGSGHVLRRLGIPSRVQRRLPDATIRTVVPMTAEGDVGARIEEAVAQHDADWLWITPERER